MSRQTNKSAAVIPNNPIYIVAKNDVTLSIDGKQNKRLPESIYATQGWDEGLPFDCSTVNYIWNNHGSWIDYLNKQRPVDLASIMNKISDLETLHKKDIKALTDKHNIDMSSANDRMAAMQIKVGGYYHGGATNPATHLLYGTWVKVAADLTLRSANVDGAVTGDNDPAVPLKKHKHSVTISNAGLHTHLQDPKTGLTNSGGQTDLYSGSPSTGQGGTTQSAGDHIHTATCADTGEDAPTIDVRGKHIPCVIWKRTS